ncbi:MAG: ATP-grasp domain-containing protein [Anaerolineae bacterium]|nr:ATP-grasp domain-containing protein [Anaerolineae bacterium]MDW8071496.1 ATP-grasp domain-containing protein [Anaerolineae bacterium]
MRADDQEPPGVVVLYNHSTQLLKGEPRDLIADQEVVQCAHAVAAALQYKGYRTALVPIAPAGGICEDAVLASCLSANPVTRASVEVEVALIPYPPTEWVVFNLGEGLEGRLFEDARIAWALEAMGYRFTGCAGDAISRSLNKARAKQLLVQHGVATPPWKVFRHPDEVTRSALEGVRFPVIVKPVAEDASLGIGPEAVVADVRATRDRVAYIVETYRQAALVEQFIDGREFNVALWGDPVEVLPLAEVDFSAFANPRERIVSFAAKWEQDSFEYWHTPVQCPARVDEPLAGRIVQTARRSWETIGCRGYARVDMRIGPDEVPLVVEVNCNPDLSPDAGFYRAARAAGYSYADMIEHILLLALEADSAAPNPRSPT